MLFFFLTIVVQLKMTNWNIIHMWFFFFFGHQSKQKRNLFVLMVFDSGEVSLFLQGYRPLLVLIRNSLMWLRTLLSYMNEFLNAFRHCKHCWHKPASWCIVCARAERERVGLFWDEVRVQVMKIWERERERVGLFGMRSGFK